MDDLRRHKMRSAAVMTAAALLVLFLARGADAIVQVGNPAPDFSLRDVDGKKFKLSKLKGGKAIVLVFWSTWSENSPEALRRFEEFHRQHLDKGIDVVGINADEQKLSENDTAEIGKRMKEAGVTFTVLLDDGLKTFRLYGIVALPSTVVIREGRIAYTLPGWPLEGTEDMFDYLREIAP